jgi:hypothetical protein
MFAFQKIEAVCSTTIRRAPSGASLARLVKSSLLALPALARFVKNTLLV